MSDTLPAPRIGAVLDGRYRIERLIGRGGMGAVYEGVQLELSRRVAIKVLEGAAAEDPGEFAAAAREARAAAQLAHPHIVQVTDFGATKGEPFLVMELLQGESLAERLARVGRLDADAAVFVAVQVLSALAAAHDAGLVHRDVKPANVYLARTAATHDFVKLLDFGIAWNTRSATSSRGRPTAGTPAFMAPEQILGEAIDARTDVWAVGVCLFETLAGRRPFSATTASELLAKIATEPPASLRNLAPGVSPELDQIVRRALAKSPAERFHGAEEMRAALAPLARTAAVPSKAIGAAPGGDAIADTIRDQRQRTALPVGTTLSIPSRRPATVETSVATVTSAERTPPERSRAAADTLASNAPPTLTSGASLKPTARAGRWRTRVALLAGIAGIAAIGVAAASALPRRPGSLDASPIVPPTCRAIQTLDPWPVAGRIDLAAARGELIVASDVPAGLPHFALAGKDAPGLSPWADPRFSYYVNGVRGLGCAGSTRGSVAAAVVAEQETGGVFSLFGVHDAPIGPDGSSILFAGTVLPHHARVLRCAHSADATLFVSLGDDSPMPGFPQIPDQLRLVVQGDGPAHPTALLSVSRLVDFSAAMSPEVVAIALVRDEDLTLGVASPSSLTVDLVPIARGKAEVPAVTIAQSRIHLAWRPQKENVLRWASADSKGNHFVLGELAAADVVAPPALATRGEQVVLGYARRAGSSVELLVGEGPTLPEAADHAAVVARASAVSSVHVASGDTSWLVWVEPEPSGQRNAHVVALACP